MLATRNIVQGHLLKDLPYKMAQYSLMLISVVKDKKTIRPTEIYKPWLIDSYSSEGFSPMN